MAPAGVDNLPAHSSAYWSRGSAQSSAVADPPPEHRRLAWPLSSRRSSGARRITKRVSGASGLRPDHTAIGYPMPRFRGADEIEIDALFAYLRDFPPRQNQVPG